MGGATSQIPWVVEVHPTSWLGHPERQVEASTPLLSSSSGTAFTAAPPSGCHHLCLPELNIVTLSSECPGTVLHRCKPSLPLLSWFPSFGKEQRTQTHFSWGTQAGCFTITTPFYHMFSLKELPQEMLVNRTCCTGSSQDTKHHVSSSPLRTLHILPSSFHLH